MTSITATAITELPEASRLRVLLADSDREEHLLMSAFSARWASDVELEFATDGAELLLKLALIDSIDQLPHLLIINRYMAKYDGLRTLCELQAHPILWQIPVMVIVDNDDIRAEIDCYRSGACWVQTKAKTLNEMHDFVERIETFAASVFSYHPCGSIDLTLFNAEYASVIEESYRAEVSQRKFL